MTQKSKKQMLMLQLLQNFQDFGSFKKKQDEQLGIAPSTSTGMLKNLATGSVSTKNIDSKSIMLLAADGNVI